MVGSETGRVYWPKMLRLLRPIRPRSFHQSARPPGSRYFATLLQSSRCRAIGRYVLRPAPAVIHGERSRTVRQEHAIRPLDFVSKAAGRDATRGQHAGVCPDADAVPQKHAGPVLREWRLGDFKISVEIEQRVVRGEFPGSALRRVLDWADLHQSELLDNWQLARTGAPLQRIDPLP